MLIPRPRVDRKSLFLDAGYTYRPKNLFSRLTFFDGYTVEWKHIVLRARIELTFVLHRTTQRADPRNVADPAGFICPGL